MTLTTVTPNGIVTPNTLMWVNAYVPGRKSVEKCLPSREAVALYGRLADECAIEEARIEIASGTGRHHRKTRSVFRGGRWIDSSVG